MPIAGDAGREGDEDLLVLVHEQAAGERSLQPRQHLLALGRRRLRQEDDELLAAVARDPVGRPERLAHDRGERLQRLVAGAVAELVVELLEVVDVEQADRKLAAAPLEAGALDLERLHQAAPVRDLRQLVGRDLVREPLHLVLELRHALAQVGRLAVLFLQALLRLLDERLHGPALGDHLADDAGQALERIRFLDHRGVAADALVEVAGLGAQLAELGEHLRHQRLERVARLLALAAHLGMLLARVMQHVAHRADAARAQALFDLELHRLALALDPAAVLGQFGQARGQLVAQLAELLEQVMAVLQDALDPTRQAFDVGGGRRRSVLAVEARDQAGELLGEFLVGAVVRRQRLLQRMAERARDALPCRARGARTRRHGRGRRRVGGLARIGHHGARPRRAPASSGAGRVDTAATAASPSATGVAAESLSQLLTSCESRCCSFFASLRPPARTRWMPSLRRAGVQLWPLRSMPRMIRSIRVASASVESGGGSPASWRYARS